MAQQINPKVAIGVDIGSSKIAITIGQYKEGMTSVIGLGTAVNSGLRRGMINDTDEVISSLSQAMEEAQRMCGVPIDHAMVGISGVGTKTVASKSVVAVTQGDGAITDAEVDSVIESARSIALPPNHEIIHVFPLIFTIDGQEKTKDPIGMRGLRLEGEILVVGVPTASVTNLTKITSQAEIAVDGLIFNPIASARAILNKKQKEQGVVLIDIGAGTTSYAVYEEGELIDANVIPVGSSHITNDIAIGLKTTLDVAEKIKCNHLDANPDKVKDQEIDLSKFDGGEEEEGKASKIEVTQIADARLKELFGMVRKELKKIKRDSMLPAGAVITGGGAKLKGIIQQAKLNLDLPAQIGIPTLEVGGTIDKLDDPSYSTSIGLMLFGLEMEPQEGTGGGFSFKFKNAKMGELADKARSIFKQFLP